MNKESRITAVLSSLSVVLLAGAVAGMTLKDCSAPVITLVGKNNLIYREGDSYEKLLENMRVEDERDGDVTDSLRVSNIYVTSMDRAMVVYVAKDHANNIAKMKREVRYEKKVPVEENVYTIKDIEGQISKEGTVATTDATSQTESAQVQTGPKIVMLQTEASIKIGETFNIYHYIQRAVDENGNDILRSMHIDGTYDMTKAGVYELQLYVINASGVRSKTETFTLIVTE